MDIPCIDQTKMEFILVFALAIEQLINSNEIYLFDQPSEQQD